MTERDILTQGAQRMGLALSHEAETRLLHFLSLVLEKNRVMNLTAITDPAEAAEKHLLDCLALALCPEIASLLEKPGARIIDVGCGAGFPGVPLKLYRPELSVTLLDSLEKRLNFIGESLDLLQLSAPLVHARAEEGAHLPELREGFDLAVSRAVASMPMLVELCLPYVRVGGLFAAMKSTACAEEAAAAESAIARLGGASVGYFDYSLYPSGISHRILLVKKIAATPARYPRRWAKIKAASL